MSGQDLKHTYLGDIEMVPTIVTEEQIKESKDLFNALFLIASNDGDSYRKKDAAGAAKKAADYYLTLMMRDLRSDIKAEKPKVVAELKKRWKQADKDYRRNLR